MRAFSHNAKNGPRRIAHQATRIANVQRFAGSKHRSLSPTTKDFNASSIAKRCTNQKRDDSWKSLCASNIRHFHTASLNPNNQPPAPVHNFFVYLKPGLSFQAAKATKTQIEQLVAQFYFSRKDPFVNEPELLSEGAFTVVGQHAIHFSTNILNFQSWLLNLLHGLNVLENVSVALHYYTKDQFNHLRALLESREKSVEVICNSTIPPSPDKKSFLMITPRGTVEADLQPQSEMLKEMGVSADVETIPVNFVLGNMLAPVFVVTLPADRLDAAVALQQLEKSTKHEDASVAKLAELLGMELWRAHAIWMELFGKDE